jgi:hypothetical protein
MPDRNSPEPQTTTIEWILDHFGSDSDTILFGDALRLFYNFAVHTKAKWLILGRSFVTTNGTIVQYKGLPGNSRFSPPIGGKW